jgi:hypothetical protein
VARVSIERHNERGFGYLAVTVGRVQLFWSYSTDSRFIEYGLALRVSAKEVNVDLSPGHFIVKWLNPDIADEVHRRPTGEVASDTEPGGG